MADNITIKDGTGANVVLGAKDNSSVYYPKHMTVDASGNAMPTGDTVARRVYTQPTDGTTAAVLGGTTNMAAFLTNAAQLVSEPGEEFATDSIVTGTTTPSATLAAAGSGIKYVVKSITIALAATSDQVPLLFKLTQDKAGTPVVLWTGTLAALAKTSQNISLSGLNIIQSVANKSLHLEVTAGTIVSTSYISVSFSCARCS
jgi:hypothetical protein